MTGKDRLALLLKGHVPDRPPHFELDFHLAKEMFGMDPAGVKEKAYSSETARLDALLGFHIELQHHLVEDLGYAVASFSAEHPPEQGITKVKEALGDRALISGYDWSGIFWMPSGSDIMDFVVKMFERPDEMHSEARKKCDVAKDRLKMQADAGADFFLLCYDFGFNEGPFISPGHFREFVTPYLAELVAAAHDLGKKAILHSDGDLREILDQIYSTGIDGYQSIDPQGHMDIKEVRRQYPDLILMGNVACNMLQDADEEKIRESVQYCMEHGGLGKPYIFSTSNCIFPGMPPESYRIMLDEYDRIAMHTNGARPDGA